MLRHQTKIKTSNSLNVYNNVYLNVHTNGKLNEHQTMSNINMFLNEFSLTGELLKEKELINISLMQTKCLNLSRILSEMMEKTLKKKKSTHHSDKPEHNCDTSRNFPPEPPANLITSRSIPNNCPRMNHIQCNEMNYAWVQV